MVSRPSTQAWLYTKCLQEERKMAMFAQYAMAATEEALEDAGWKPTVFEQREATVIFP